MNKNIVFQRKEVFKETWEQMVAHVKNVPIVCRYNFTKLVKTGKQEIFSQQLLETYDVALFFPLIILSFHTSLTCCQK